MAAKRPVDLLWISEDPSQPQPRPGKRQPRPAPEPKLPEPLFKASLTTLTEASPTPSSATADLDDAIIQRITKCLSRAHHQTTPEVEAKAALHLASRLMRQHNVSQAEVLAYEPPSKRAQYTGQSIVAIERTDGDKWKMVRIQGYVETLVNAVKTFFSCKSYLSRRKMCAEWTFYGLAENTVAAAMAFEMAYNLVVGWPMRYRGQDRPSYIQGAFDELRYMARKERDGETKKALEAEKEAVAARERTKNAERQVQLDRLAVGHDDDAVAAVEPQPRVATVETEGYGLVKAGGFSSGFNAHPDAPSPFPADDIVLGYWNADAAHSRPPKDPSWKKLCM